MNYLVNELVAPGGRSAIGSSKHVFYGRVLTKIPEHKDRLVISKPIEAEAIVRPRGSGWGWVVEIPATGAVEKLSVGCLDALRHASRHGILAKFRASRLRDPKLAEVRSSVE